MIPVLFVMMTDPNVGVDTVRRSRWGFSDRVSSCRGDSKLKDVSGVTSADISCRRREVFRGRAGAGVSAMVRALRTGAEVVL